MTPKQIELVENSWDLILHDTKNAGMIFYARLFEIAPELKPLFKESPEAQAQKLESLITFAVHKLNTLDEIVNDVKSLGKRHKKYNVKPEHYGIVAEALLWTLEKALQEKWNKEMKDAWVAVYTVLSTTMIGAAQEA
jgi:hemoglobin-like flavoprotein